MQYIISFLTRVIIFKFKCYRNIKNSSICMTIDTLINNYDNTAVFKEYLSLIHISEPTRQAEISYAVFCLKKKKQKLKRKKKKKSE